MTIISLCWEWWRQGLKGKFHWNFYENYPQAQVWPLFPLWWWYFEVVAHVSRWNLARGSQSLGLFSLSCVCSLLLLSGSLTSLSSLLPTAVTLCSCSDHVLNDCAPGINRIKLCRLQMKHWAQISSFFHAWHFSRDLSRLQWRSVSLCEYLKINVCFSWIT